MVKWCHSRSLYSHWYVTTALNTFWTKTICFTSWYSETWQTL